MTRNPLTASTRILHALCLSPMSTHTLSKVLTLNRDYVEQCLHRLMEFKKVWPVGVESRPPRHHGAMGILYGIRQ